MSLIYDRPSEPLRIYCEDAVLHGESCAFCGTDLSLPIVRHAFMNGARPIWLHPPCALELMAFLGADVKDALSVLNAHAAIQFPRKAGHDAISA